MPDSAPTPQAIVDRVRDSSSDVRTALVLEGSERLAAHAGAGDGGVERLGELAAKLLRAGDGAGVRAGLDAVTKIEVSRPEAAVFAVRDTRHDRTLVAVADGATLPSLMLYDMQMALAGTGSDASGAAR